MIKLELIFKCKAKVCNCYSTLCIYLGDIQLLRYHKTINIWTAPLPPCLHLPQMFTSLHQALKHPLQKKVNHVIL